LCGIIYKCEMRPVKINHLLNESAKKNLIYVVRGWVRTFRANRFIALNDGSSVKNLQCVIDFENLDESKLKLITTGAALHLEGILINSQGSGQKVELSVIKFDIIGDCDPEKYPIQPKKHSLEYLRGKSTSKNQNLYFCFCYENSIIPFISHT